MEPSTTQILGRSVASELRTVASTWAVAALLPLPVLVVTGPAGGTDVACLYLGLACAWLVTEFHRVRGNPASEWGERMLAVVMAVALNVALFVTFGIAAGVESHFPFPLMAAFSAVPAVCVVPALLRRVPSHPYAAILLAGVLVGACKLAACVVARVVYGPDCMALGYIAADWRTAKLMISLMWTFSSALSVGMLAWEYRRASRRGSSPETPSVREPSDAVEMLGAS